MKKLQRDYIKNPSHINDSFQSDIYSNRSLANISTRTDEDDDLYDRKNDRLEDRPKFSSYYSNEMIEPSLNRQPTQSRLSPRKRLPTSHLPILLFKKLV
jgi:hypothetical protein